MTSLDNGQTSTLREHLRLVTMPLHRSVETGLNLDSLSSLPAYKFILERFLGLYRPLENALGRLDMAGLGIDFEARRKVRWLEQDLIDLGHTGDSVAGLPEPPRIALPGTPHEGLGVLYVLEGSSLGGQLIIRKLGPKLNITPGWAGRFHYAYGKNTGQMWRSYLAVLEASRLVPGAAPDIERAALATFASFERYLVPGPCSFGAAD